MKKRMVATILVLCMVLGMLPGTAWAANRPGNSAYWENLSVTDANAMAEAIASRSSTEDLVLLYTWEDARFNSTFADLAAEKQIKVGSYYKEDGRFDGIWKITGYITIRFPVVVAYNGATRNYKVSIGDSSVASFEKLLEEAGLLGGSGSVGLQPLYSSNAGNQNYSRYAASTVKSHLYENEIGGVTRVEYYGSTVMVEDYDRTYKLQSRKEIPAELPIWGGFFAGENNNFLVFGQANPQEQDSVEVIRIVKYSKDWERQGAASLHGANTFIPFDAGSLRCDEYNGMLYIRSSHEMYESNDGKNHQANIMIQVKESDMTVVDSFMGVANIGVGYVSHSFNQFVMIDQEQNIVAVDHGDAHPRSIVLTRYRAKAGTDKFSGGCDNSTIQALPGGTGDNATGAAVGGLAETSTGYVTAYNYDGNGTGSGPRSIYLAYTSKNGLSTSTPARVTSGGDYSAPVLAPTGLSGGYLLWNDANISSGTLYYAPYSADGTVGTTRTASALLSDCQPILHNGKLVWYTTNSSAPVFYTLDESGVTAIPSINESCPVHNWGDGVVTTEPTCEKEGVKTFTCTLCGETKTEPIEKLPHTPGGDMKYNGDETHSGTCVVCGAALDSEPCDYSGEIEVIKEATCTEEGERTIACTVCGSKKTEIIEKAAHTPGDDIIYNGDHTHSGTCAVCGAALDSEPCDYSGEIEVIKEATCTEEGERTIACTVCGSKKTETIEKAPHTPGGDMKYNGDGTHSGTCAVCGAALDSELCDYSGEIEVIKEATCTEEGERTIACTVCGSKKTESIEKAPHTPGGDMKYNGDGTHSGTCAVCGTALSSEPCDYSGEIEVIKEATCTEEGERTIACTVCGSKKTESIEKAPHTPGGDMKYNGDGTHSGTCAVCGAALDSEPCDYSGEIEVIKEATCTEDGERTIACTVCGSKKTETIEKLPHTPGGDMKYNGDGTHSGTCAVCGTALDSEPCDYSGAAEVIKEATCTEDGEQVRTCAVCGSKKTEEIPALGHNYQNYRCAHCGTVIPESLEDAYDEIAQLDNKSFSIDFVLSLSRVASYIQNRIEEMLGASYTVSVQVLDLDDVQTDTSRCVYTVSVKNAAGDVFMTQQMTMDLTVEEDDETFYIFIPSTANGSVIPSTRHAARGDRVTLSVHPDSEYELDTLTVTDARGRAITTRGSGDSYSFTMPSSRVTVEAAFVKVSTPGDLPADDDIYTQPFTGLGTPGISGIVLNPAPMPFTDVRSTDWFYNHVDYVWKHYLMSGVSDTTFSPHTTTSRGMIWTILARMNNIRTDVNPGATWYKRGMLWAMQQGVTDGTNPMGEVTREQLATMLWRNAGSPYIPADLSRFSDSASVSSYARSAVSWAVANGILNGSNGKLDPQGTATRAQVAAMTARYGDQVA